jgi:hypothetical protein
MRSWVLALSLWLASTGVALAQSARISMSASSNRVAVGEPFAVEIRIETHGDEPDSVELPDFGALQVLGRSTSRPFSFSFGFGGGQRARVKSETVYGFTLRATERGAFSLRPAIMTVKGRRVASQSLNIMVVDQGNAVLGGDPRPSRDDQDAPDRDTPPAVAAGEPVDGANVDPTMFVRTVVDKKRAYLGEQVTVTIYLYLRGQLGDSPSITREATLDGFWSNDLLPMQRSLSAARQEIQGKTYNAYVLRRFAAFPLRTGKLEIGAPAVEVGAGGSIFDLLNGPGRPTRRDGVKVSVEVLPLPAQPNPGKPTHTGTLALEATLDGAQAKVGEAVTLRVVAKGAGNLRNLQLKGPTLANVDTLAPEIDDEVGAQSDVIGGMRTFRWLLLPRAPGTVSIPSFVVDVFDPAGAQFGTVRSNPLSLLVSGAASDPGASANPGEVTKAEAPTEVEAAPHFGPARPSSELTRRERPLHERGWFWPGVLAAPLLLLLWLGARALQQRMLQQRAGNHDGVQLREVDEALASALKASQGGDANGTLSALASALKKAVSVRLGEPIGGMTQRALEGQLASHRVDDRLSARVLAQLGALERARFDPNAQGAIELAHAVEGVRALVRDLARDKPGRSA